MLNNFCFKVYAQKSLFIVENVNAFTVMIIMITLITVMITMIIMMITIMLTMITMKL